MKTLFYFFSSFVILTIVLTSTSCEKYHDGQPGRAFISLSWSNDEPDYIETGNSSIPVSFFYDDYYETNTGFYTLYYEGKVWNGTSYSKYAWEVDYEIWINPGEVSDGRSDGLDGLDNFFNIDLSPFGPYTSSYSARKSNTIKNNIKEIKPGVFQILQQSNEYHLKITYRNVTLKN